MSIKHLLMVTLVPVVAMMGVGDRALAQITPDTTLGAERSIVTPTNINSLPSDKIDGGAKRGANLFHSFLELNVGTGRGVYFTNPAGVENIISRVTGSNPSNIFGKLGVLGGSANLFLINPNGIIFGPNASLDVGGSFVASTASSLKFADGTEFSATAPQTASLLTISVPIGLQFGANPGSILNQSQATDSSGSTFGLQVADGNTLALVGGNVSLVGGNLTVEGGRIELGSIAGPGLVSLTPIDKGWSLGYKGVSTFGQIYLSHAQIYSAGVAGGDLQVQGSQVTLTDGSQVTANTNHQDNAQGLEAGATVNIVGSDLVQLIGGSTLFAGNFSDGAAENVTISTSKLMVLDQAQINTRNFAKGQGINLTINTGKLLISNGGAITNYVFSSGLGGNINVNASDSVQLTTGSKLESLTLFDGLGGDLKIVTGSLLLSEDAIVDAKSFFGAKGQGGNLSVMASSIQLSGESQLATGTNYGSSGASGQLTINTGKLTIQDESQIASSTLGTGNAGNISITASDSVDLKGVSLENTLTARIVAETFFGAGGGNITITTGKLLLSDNAEVGTNTFGQGNGGNINIRADDSIELIGTGKYNPLRRTSLSADTFSNGNAGNVKIETGQLTIRDGAEISVLSAFPPGATGTGQLGTAGKLEVTAGSIRLDNQGRITATTAQGNGGDITVQAMDLLLLRRGSQISTTAGTARSGGNGGNITLNTPLLVAIPSENSDISANAFTGNGGQVTINTTAIFGTGFQKFDTPQSDITASSQFGVNGTVNLNTPNVNPSNGLVTLPAAVVDPSRRIAQSCGAGEVTNTSQFIVTGRGGLPPNPGEVLSRNVVLADTRLPATTAHPQRSATVTAAPSSQLGSLPAPATGVMFNSKGQVTLLAAAPTARLEIPWLSPHTCNVK